MLEELHVRDLALIEEVWLEFGPGMTVLTGETGAGKTVLVGALKLLLGERADAASVRSGASEAVVEGRFVAGAEERTVRRRVSADGRSRCYLDGEIATVGGLADALGPLVDLHGQHDHQLLLQPASHAQLFDAFIGPEAAGALETYRGAYAAVSSLREHRDLLAAAMLDRDRVRERLRFVIGEIDGIGPESGEDEAIAAELPRMRHGERLTLAASAAYAALSQDGGATDGASQALAALQRVASVDPALDVMTGELDEAVAVLGDIAHRLREYGEAIDYDASALNEAEARLAALTDLKRKHGPTLDDVLSARQAAATELDEIEAGEHGLERAEAALADADGMLTEVAERVAAVRAAATASFEARLAEAAGDLAMPTARFEVDRRPVARGSWTAAGPERVEFLFAPASGEQARPLARIASGGEVSRVMLALKGVLGAADTVPVLVFDEIDSGIGGATAQAVGSRLKELSREHQVLVVTHLAQVAAFADAHIVVVKTEEGGRARTGVSTCTGAERVAELARMLSGTESTASLAHARELLSATGVGAV